MASRARTPNSASNSGITAFATVGTTRFDLFVQRLDDPQVQTALRGIGIDKLVVQKGNSSVSPQSRVEGMKVEAFEFAHGLQSVTCARRRPAHLLCYQPFSPLHPTVNSLSVLRLRIPRSFARR
jgi:hypothetical protein